MQLKNFVKENVRPKCSVLEGSTVIKLEARKRSSEDRIEYMMKVTKTKCILRVMDKHLVEIRDQKGTITKRGTDTLPGLRVTMTAPDHLATPSVSVETASKT